MTVRRVEKGYTPFLSTQKKFADDLGMSITDVFGSPALPAVASVFLPPAGEGAVA